MAKSAKDEVVLVAGAIAAVAQVVIAATTGHIDLGLVTAAVTAVTAAVTRQHVTPVRRVR